MANPFDNYQDAAVSDAAGYWNPEDGPIHCIPLGVKLLDNKKNKNNPSGLVFAKLVDPCKIISKKGDDKQVITAKPGTIVAIWHKPGMKGLEIAFMRKTAMRLNPEKNVDTGKGNEMIGFDVVCDPNSKPAKLPVFSDDREHSKYAKTVFAEQREKAQEGPSKEDMGDIPF